MRIESLYIDGFGIFAQAKFGPFDSPIIIFKGANEKGKTTLLAFIRTVLFGFPSRGRDSYYPPLRGGRQGGRITIVDTSGARYTIERYVGARGGKFTVKDQDGTPYDAAKLQQLVGHASLELFSTVFAFGLDELQDIKSLDEEEVQGRIYSAGLGVANLPQVEKNIRTAQEKLYRPGGNMGKNQAIAGVIEALKEVETALAEHQADAPRYAELTARQDEIAEELRQLDERRTGFRRLLVHQQKLVDGHLDLMEIDILEEKLASLLKFPQFPEDAITRLENLLDKVNTAEEAAIQATDALSKGRGPAERPLEGQALLDDAAKIRQAIGEGSRLEAAIRDLPERIGEASQQETGVAQLLTELGSGWDEARVDAFDTSLPVRDTVNQRKEQVNYLSQIVTNRQNQLEAAEREERAALEAEREAASSLEQSVPPRLDETALTQRLEAARTAGDAVRRHWEARERLLELRVRGGVSITGGARTLALAIAVTLAALGGATLAWALAGGSGSPVMVGAAVLIVAGGGAGVYAYRSRNRPAALVAQIKEAKRELEDTKQDLDTAAATLQVDTLDSETVEAVKKDLDDVRLQLTAWQTLARNHQEAQRRLNGRLQERERTANARTEANEELTEAYVRWQKWLRGCSLLDTLSPDGVLELLSRVDATRARLSSLRDRRDRVAGIQRDIQEIGELVVSLAKKHDVPSDGDRPSTLVAAIAELALRLEKAQRELQEKKDDLQALNQAEERQNQEARHLDKAREDLSNLLHFGGTDDSEEFRRRTSIYNERKECERRLENHRTILRRLFGPDADLTTPRAEIDGRTVEPLQEAVDETEQSITDTESRRDGLRDEAVRVEQELAALSTSEEASALRAEREQRREELQRVAGQWAKFTVALGMLRLAREQYERERQPKVVQEAERFFSKVTGGRYTGLRAPVGESTINVISTTGEEKKPAQLSRGTREQLYLALRFGFVREYSQQVVALPVIVDDALVNFDPRRAQAAAEAFTELAETNQVLVFTCHPTFVDLFQKACPDAAIISLDA